jgi:hypothetical protein
MSKVIIALHESTSAETDGMPFHGGEKAAQEWRKKYGVKIASMEPDDNGAVSVKFSGSKEKLRKLLKEYHGTDLNDSEIEAQIVPSMKKTTPKSEGKKWFDSLTDVQKQTYVKLHPRSKHHL